MMWHKAEWMMVAMANQNIVHYHQNVEMLDQLLVSEKSPPFVRHEHDVDPQPTCARNHLRISVFNDLII